MPEQRRPNLTLDLSGVDQTPLIKPSTKYNVNGDGYSKPSKEKEKYKNPKNKKKKVRFAPGTKR